MSVSFLLTVFVIKLAVQLPCSPAQFLQRGSVLAYKKRISDKTEILITFRRKTGIHLCFHGNKLLN